MLIRRNIAVFICVCCMIIGFSTTAFAADDEFGLFDIENVDNEGVQTIAEGFLGDDVTWTLYENGLLEILRPEEEPIGEIEPDSPCGLWSSHSGHRELEQYKDQITEVVMSGEIGRLYGEGYFEGWTSLKTITIPGSVVFIEQKAFTGCSSLESIYYEGSLESWYRMASVENTLAVPKECRLYVDGQDAGSAIPPLTLPAEGRAGEDAVWSLDENGCLTISGTGMLYDEVNSIDEYGNVYMDHSGTWHAYGEYITGIIVEDGITGFAENQFCSCINAETLAIPDSVTCIEENAIPFFKGSLHTIYFGGSKNEWNSLFDGRQIPEEITIVYAVGETDTRIVLKSVTLSKESMTYNGRALQPSETVTAKVNGMETTLVKDTDYTVSYSNNKNVGTAIVKVTGIGDYKGIIETTFQINPASISKSTVEIESGKTSYTYTGSAFKPEVVVTSSVTGKTLKNGKDYKVTYKNNKNAGTATIKVTGIGNYKSTAKTTFEINPVSISKSKVVLKSGKTSYTYTGSAIKPAVVVTSSVTGKTLKKGTDYTVAYKNNKNIGKATITITGIGNYKSTLKTTFVIKQKNIRDVVSLKSTYLYTGKPVKPGIISSLKKNVDYTVTYQNNTDTYYTWFFLKNNREAPCAIVKGIGNYKGTVKLTFDIVSEVLIYAKGHEDPNSLLYLSASVGDSFQLQLKNSSDGKIQSSKGGTWRIEESTCFDSSAVTVTKSGKVTALKKGATVVSYTKDNKEVLWTCIFVGE